MEQAERFSKWLELANSPSDCIDDAGESSVAVGDTGSLHVRLRIPWLPADAELVELELWQTLIEGYIVCTSTFRSLIPRYGSPRPKSIFTETNAARIDRCMRIPDFPPPPSSYMEIVDPLAHPSVRTPRGVPYGRRLIHVGTGDTMKEMVETYPWEKTPLGPRSQWSSSLFSAVSYILDHPWPKAIWWGKDLVLLYNDAYKELVAHKHPHIFAESGSVCWAELWDSIGPAIEKVFTGAATWKTDDLLFLARMTEARLPEETYQSWNIVPFREGPDKPVAGLINGTIGV